VEPELVSENYGSTEPLRLQGLEYLGSYEGATFADLPGNLQTRIEETELLVHLIRSGTPDPVKFNIFARINTGGLPLTPQELRHALIAGPARELLAELAGTVEFARATGYSVRTERMQDREMVLRFLAFLIRGTETYRGDLDTYLRDAMLEINHLQSRQQDQLAYAFRYAMNAAFAIFGQHAFRKRNIEQPQYRQPVNKALFEAIAVNLALLTPQDIAALTARNTLVNDLFIDLMSDRSFFNAISVGTGDMFKVQIRFGTIRRLFREVLA
jgi:hypothetical protein